MYPKLRDWEGERVPKIDEIWMLACIKKSMQNKWFWRPKFKKIVKKTVPRTMYFSHAFFYRFHVLRTYRRAALWKRKTESECQQGFFAAIPAACRKMPSRAKCVPTYGQLGAPKSRLERPKSRKKRPKGATNAARREKCAQEALKSEKCANIEPTWRNFGLPTLAW